MYIKPFNVKKNRKVKTGVFVSEVCPWVLCVESGIVLLKTGAFCRTYEYTPPDLGSSSAEKIAGVCASFNRSIMQLGENWGVQFEVQRSFAPVYLGAQFANPASYIVDAQREIQYNNVGSHFYSHYYITLTYQLPSDIQSKTTNVFFKQSKVYDGLNTSVIRSELNFFKMQTDKALSPLKARMAVKALNSNETAAYLHTSISLNWHPVKTANRGGMFLDRLLPDTQIETSIPLKVGEYYVPILGIADFPGETIPAMLDGLNAAQIPYRWSTRFITYSQDTAKKKLEMYQKKYYGGRKGLGQLAAETVLNFESDRVNHGAVAQEEDTNGAIIELTMGSFGFGEYTSNIAVWDNDYDRAIDKAKYIAGVIGACGFTARDETLGAMQAYLSMQPGNMYANIRKTIISTGNLSHCIPVSAVWAGEKHNAFLEYITGVGIPHVICSTQYSTPFYLNLNVRDVGHTWISGPTGAGKSTLLALLENQWLKYPKAKVIILDKDRSARGLTICSGGIYLEPGKDDVAFQPLSQLETMEQRRWSAEFIECLLAEQKVSITAAMRKAIFDGLTLLSTKPVNVRTLTSFQQYCNYTNPETGVNDIVIGISPYTLSGQYGSLFDADSTHLPVTNWTMFEMGTLMNMAAGAIAPSLMFIFREIEKHFTGEPVLLVLDEAWVFLRNPVFAAKIVDWLKTLRKKHVFCVFATQEIDDAANSPIASTIISQCASKIYLADPSASSPMVKDAYKKFGLDDAEINLLANAQIKQDYYYKSSLGCRLFNLNLDSIQLAVLTTDHDICDKVELIHGINSGKKLVDEILTATGDRK